MSGPAPERVAARAGALHEGVEAALTTARDPFTRRELVHAAIDRALAGYDVMEQGHRLRAALRTLANEAALLAWRDDLIEDGTDPADLPVPPAPLLDPDPLYEPGPESRWHAEPVRAAHHRRVGFVFGLVAGIVVTLLARAVGL